LINEGLYAVSFLHTLVPLITGIAAMNCRRCKWLCDSIRVYGLLTVFCGFLAVVLGVRNGVLSGIFGEEWVFGLGMSILIVALWWTGFYRQTSVCDVVQGLARAPLSAFLTVIVAASEELIWRSYFSTAVRIQGLDLKVALWLFIGFICLHLYGISLSRLRFLLLLTVLLILIAGVLGLGWAILVHSTNNLLIDSHRKAGKGQNDSPNFRLR